MSGSDEDELDAATLSKRRRPFIASQNEGWFYSCILFYSIWQDYRHNIWLASANQMKANNLVDACSTIDLICPFFGVKFKKKGRNDY